MNGRAVAGETPAIKQSSLPRKTKKKNKEVMISHKGKLSRISAIG